MLFYEFYIKACEEVISCSDSGMYYLEPDYKGLLEDVGLKLENVTDRIMTQEEFRDMLDLRVKKMNASTDRSRVVFNWIANIIETKADPAMISEENELVKNIIEYLQTSAQVEQKEKELADKEAEIDAEKKRSAVLPSFVNVSKRGADE